MNEYTNDSFHEKEFEIKKKLNYNKLLKKILLKNILNKQKMRLKIKRVFLNNNIISILSNIFIFFLIMIKKIKATQILKLVVNGTKNKVLNSGTIPDRVYINGTLTNIDVAFRVFAIKPGINYITLEWDQKRWKYERMFRDLENIIEADFSYFDLSGVTSLKELFQGDSNLIYVNFSNVDTSSVTLMSSLFEGCETLKSIDLSNFDTSSVVQLDKMFKDCKSLVSLNLTNFRTPNLRKMNYLFQGCLQLKYLNLSSFTTDLVTGMDSMFCDCISLTSINILNFNTENTIIMDNMFAGCKSLKEIDLSNMYTKNVKYMYSMFYGCTSLISLNLSSFITSKVEDMENMFSGCNSLKYLYMPNFNLEYVSFMKNMFRNCYSLLSLDLSSFDFSYINIESIFYNCHSLTSIIFSKKQKLSGNITQMFYNCSSLKSLDFSYFNFDQVENADYLFYNCFSLKFLDLSDIDAWSVEKMDYMFYSCKSLTSINFANFQTIYASSFNNMFSNCKSLKFLDLSGFTTFSVKTMQSMFENCNSLTSVDLSSFQTSNVENMNSMFQNCYSLKSLDLSNFDISYDISFVNMFNNCSKLKYINFYYLNDYSKVYNNMFYKTSKLLVVCLRETPDSSLFLEQFSDKRCIISDCSVKINDDRSIIYDTKQCINDCQESERYTFKYNYFCYEECPKGTHSSKINTYICEKKLYSCLEKYPFIIIEENICTDECSCVDFFNNICTINSINKQSHALLYQNIIKGIEDGLINDLLEESFNKGEDILKIEKNVIYQISNTSNLNNLSFINISECENILKEKYNILEDNQLFIYKTELYIDQLLIPIIDYEIFDFKTKTKLDLNICKEKNVSFNIIIPISINENTLFKYVPVSSYYTDICDYNNENEDITLYDRKNNFNNNNLSICPENCIFNSYNNMNKTVNCQCEFVDTLFLLYVNNTDEYIYKFKIEEKIHNFEILKCYNLLFSKNGLLKNAVSYIILLVIVLYIFSSIYFYQKGFDLICEEINELINNKIFEDDNKSDLNITGNLSSTKINNSNNSKNNNFRSRNILEYKLNSDILDKNKFNEKIKKKDNDKPKEYSDLEINIIPYKEALENDKRSYFQFYISLIKEKNLIISVFNDNKDYNSRIIKICLISFCFVLNLVINALFFNDYKMHSIYVDKKTYNFKNNITNIIYSLIIFSIVFIIIKRLVLTRNNILELKYEKNKYIFKGKILIVLRCIIIKCICFFIFGIIILMLFWYYLSIFCIIYKNTQSCLFLNSLISLCFYSLFKFFICLFIGVLRIFSLKEPEILIYKISQAIQSI